MEHLTDIIKRAFGAVEKNVTSNRRSYLNVELAKQGLRLKEPQKFSYNARDGETLVSFLQDTYTIVTCANTAASPEEVAHIIQLLQNLHMVTRDE